MNKIKFTPLCKGSGINVYNPDIEFFINKIEKDEYFSFTRQLHGFWDSVIGAFILEPVLRKIKKEDDAYLVQLGDAMVRAKSKRMPLKYDKDLYSDLLKFVSNINKIKGDFYYGVSDIDFYPHDPPPYSVNSYDSFFPFQNLLSIKSPLKCYKIRCGDRQEVMRYFLPDDYIPFDGIIWRKYGYHGQLQRFFEAFKDREIVLIGPPHHDGFAKVADLENYHHIEIHGTKACFERDIILDNIIQFDQKLEKKKPALYLIVAGNLGVWLTTRLHNKLEKAFIIDLGLALDPLYDKSNVTKRNPFHFFESSSENKESGRKNKTEYPNFFIHDDLGYKMQISQDGVVTFTMPSISRWHCFHRSMKSRFEYIYAYKLKTYKLKRFKLYNIMTDWYWRMSRKIFK